MKEVIQVKKSQFDPQTGESEVVSTDYLSKKGQVRAIELGEIRSVFAGDQSTIASVIIKMISQSDYEYYATEGLEVDRHEQEVIDGTQYKGKGHMFIIFTNPSSGLSLSVQRVSENTIKD